jgi:hypothetical protein
VKRGSLDGAVIDFAIFLIVLSVMDLVFKFGFEISEWNLHDARLAFNGSIAGVLTVIFFIRARFK